MTDRQPPLPRGLARPDGALPLLLTHAPAADALPGSPPAVFPPVRAESLGVPLDRDPPARARSPVVVRDWSDVAAEAA
jgi:hypothetical protein